MKKIILILALSIVGTGAMCQTGKNTKRKDTKQEIVNSDQEQSFKPSENGTASFHPKSDTKHNYQSYSYVITDRSGKTIFETSDSTQGWDGKINGRIAPEGTYNWTITYTEQGSEKAQTAHGHVTVLK